MLYFKAQAPPASKVAQIKYWWTATWKIIGFVPAVDSGPSWFCWSDWYSCPRKLCCIWMIATTEWYWSWLILLPLLRKTLLGFVLIWCQCWSSWVGWQALANGGAMCWIRWADPHWSGWTFAGMESGHRGSEDGKWNSSLFSALLAHTTCILVEPIPKIWTNQKRFVWPFMTGLIFGDIGCNCKSTLYFCGIVGSPFIRLVCWH